MAAQFLAESLSPFEMTLRTYQANARLLGLGQATAQLNADIDRSREQLRTILDATTAVIYLKDAEGRFLFVNRQFEEVFGVRRDAALGKGDDEVLPPEVARTLRGDDVEAIAARAPREIEEMLPGSDGPHTYISLKFPLLDASDSAYGLCCVATDITERKRAEEALLRAREAAVRERQLEKAVELRDQFLAVATHELKTPLTALELQVGALRRLTRAQPEVALADAKVQAKCDAMVRQVERLNVLINHLVEAGRIASERLELAREPVDLAALTAAIVRARGWDGRVRLDTDETAVKTDPRRMERILANLIGNALEHGTGTIEVRGEHSGDGLRIAVSDEGRDGRPGAVAPRAGDAVARGGALGWKVSRVGGARPRGRGLGIARRAMRDAGGSLESPDVRPPAAREGATDQSPTTVAVWLPATPSRVE
jgi:PAS domain S-box-containing protein